MGALIVLAVPMPALLILLGHIGQTAPDCPLTDVTSVKGAVLDAVTAAVEVRFVGGHPMTGTTRSGWEAGHARLFTGAPWVISVDDRVDPVVRSTVLRLALDCGSVAVPRRPTSMTQPPRRSHICRTCSRRPWPSPPPRCRWRSRWLPGSFRDGTTNTSAMGELLIQVFEPFST